MDNERISRAAPDGHPPPSEWTSFTYPTPAELARKRAEASGLMKDWSLVGGLTTLQRHGRAHFIEIARRRRSK